MVHSYKTLHWICCQSVRNYSVICTFAHPQLLSEGNILTRGAKDAWGFGIFGMWCGGWLPGGWSEVWPPVKHEGRRFRPALCPGPSPPPKVVISDKRRCWFSKTAEMGTIFATLLSIPELSIMSLSITFPPKIMWCQLCWCWLVSVLKAVSGWWWGEVVLPSVLLSFSEPWRWDWRRRCPSLVPLRRETSVGKGGFGWWRDSWPAPSEAFDEDGGCWFSSLVMRWPTHLRLSSESLILLWLNARWSSSLGLRSKPAPHSWHLKIDKNKPHSSKNTTSWVTCIVTCGQM